MHSGCFNLKRDSDTVTLPFDEESLGTLLVELLRGQCRRFGRDGMLNVRGMICKQRSLASIAVAEFLDWHERMAGSVHQQESFGHCTHLGFEVGHNFKVATH
eukprot:scaffold340472_cov45-Prasinocladus_malaysianus.AAC.1